MIVALEASSISKKAKESLEDEEELIVVVDDAEAEIEDDAAEADAIDGEAEEDSEEVLEALLTGTFGVETVGIVGMGRTAVEKS